MREKMISIGDDFWIENDHGQKVFKVDGKAHPRPPDADHRGRAGHRALPDPGADAAGQGLDGSRRRPRCAGRHGEEGADHADPRALDCQVKGGPDLEVQGNILDHEYTIGEGRDKVAEVSKKWFRLRDTYGVEIDAGQDDALILAVTVCIDQMAHA